MLSFLVSELFLAMLRVLLRMANDAFHILGASPPEKRGQAHQVLILEPADKNTTQVLLWQKLLLLLDELVQEIHVVADFGRR